MKPKIAAFNVQKFGMKKVNNKFVCDYIIKIVSRYSVVVMLEVTDQSGKAMDKFLSKLNSYRTNKNHQYTMRCSEPLGRSSYKEKFVYFFREDEVTVLYSYQYEEDEDKDVLAREPFILSFKCLNTDVKELVLIPVHTKPEDVEAELDALDNVVEAVKKDIGSDAEIMILGDFNADGRYLSEKKKKNISLYSEDYHWLIDDDVDTTTSNENDHTYDRIVVVGDIMRDAIVRGSAKSFNFQTAYNLTDEEAHSISDHYPVEVELKPRTRQRSRARR